MSGGDGSVDFDDFRHWVRRFHVPEDMHERHEEKGGEHGEEEGDEHMEEGGEHAEKVLREGSPELAHLPPAPECSDELREAEMGLVEGGHPCRNRDGNLIYRTICNMPGFDEVAITLPERRAASCFGIEAIRGHIVFEIVAEDGSPIWQMDMGPEEYKRLKLDEGVYHVRSVGGGEDGAVTVRFVDVSTE